MSLFSIKNIGFVHIGIVRFKCRTEVVNRMKCNVQIKLETNLMLRARADLERFK